MRYWWVNQNQTFHQEFDGGYLWAPKRRANGTRNPFYEFMREVSPGDLVFSFCDTRIRALGVVASHAYESPKPEEFGSAGSNWNRIGWRVDVRFQEVEKSFRPADWMEKLGPLLPARYAPLQRDGRGLQGIYLTELDELFALELAGLISKEALALARSEVVADRAALAPTPGLALWEEYLRQRIDEDRSLIETDRTALVLARRGQGLFRERVSELEDHCRVTRVNRAEHLRASHCKPWRDSNNEERLDGENGLLLTPSVDHLFDRGFISFSGSGDLLVSPVAHLPSLRSMGIPVDSELNVGAFTSGQSRFLEYHRDAVFLLAGVSRRGKLATPGGLSLG